MALGIFFLWWSLRNLNYKKFNKEIIWIYQCHKKRKKKHANTWNITIFCTNKENKKKNRLIKDKVQIENIDMRWVPVSSIGKVSYGCIRDMRFNPCLHQKLIGVLAWW